jgi:hypothetical protein
MENKLTILSAMNETDLSTLNKEQLEKLLIEITNDKQNIKNDLRQLSFTEFEYDCVRDMIAECTSDIKKIKMYLKRFFK